MHAPTAYIACYALALDGFNNCKESTALNILSSLTAEAVGPFSESAAGAINLYSASQSIDCHVRSVETCAFVSPTRSTCNA